MNTKTKRFLLLVASCSVLGIFLGGATSWKENNLCLSEKIMSSECLTQDPVSHIIQGMSSGLMAGVGAAFGVSWQYRHEE